MWEGQLSFSERGWRVIAPQLRGFDGDDGRPVVTSMDDYAGEVIDLLDGLHVEDAVIGGLSMGGYVAFAMFRHAPRYFQGVVLADTRPQADTPDGLEARSRMLALLREKGPTAVADEMIPRLLGPSTLSERPDIVDRVRGLILLNGADAIAGGIAALMARADSTDLLTSIHCPTLVVVGEHDAITPPAVGQALHEGIAGSEFAVIPNAGHLANLEQPELFNDVLARFLDHRV